MIAPLLAALARPLAGAPLQGAHAAGAHAAKDAQASPRRAACPPRSPGGRSLLLVPPLLAALALSSTPAIAEPVAVTVVEVAGDQAYVTPGRAAGLVPGTQITFRGHTAIVLEATDKTASVRLGPQALRAGDTGAADVTAAATQVVDKLPPPRPARDFAEQWRQAAPPAASQRPNAVPLGKGRAPGRLHVAVIGQAYSVASRDQIAAQVEGRLLTSVELADQLWDGRPLALDLDLAARAFADGANAGARTPLLVRAAQLRLGGARAPRLALGRLRHAAAAVGMLDGARAAVRVGQLAVAAFGGVVPDPVSGKPDPSAARFGTELSYDALALPWRPHLALTAHGSTWNGELDERRLAAAVSASAGDTWLDGWAEAQAFASTNPWGASAVELTGAGATAQWRRDGRQLGLDVTYLRPERSLRLAAALPLEELCVPASQIGDGAVTCPGGEWWASASASAGLRRRRWALDAIVSVAHSRSETSSTTRSAALRGEREVGPVRVEAGVSAGKVAFASFTAAELGAAFAPARHLDVALRYRPELLDYVASEGPVLMHSVIAEGRASPQPSLDLAASVVATTGEDRDAVALMLFVAWRPLP